ncbi:MAG: tyrosine-type recombinase/integrase [Planctomycetota bacterium]
MARQRRHSSASLRRGWLNDDETARLLAHVASKAELAKRRGSTRAIVDETIIRILLCAGLKAYELADLSIADTPAHHRRNVVIVHGKDGSSAREVTIDVETSATLVRFARLMRRGACPEEALILSERGNCLSYSSLYHKVRRIGREAGLGKIDLSVLRRTYIAKLYLREPDVHFVQQQSGHASAKATAQCIMRILRPPSRSETSCEACGRAVGHGAGTRIDSGQTLCPDCMNELRRLT